MPSHRQIAANRANASKSTGPRSKPGKKRAAANALRHGLARSLFFPPEVDDAIEAAVAQLAPGATDPRVRTYARNVIEAELELERIRSVKRALLEAPQARCSSEPAIENGTLQAVLNALPGLVSLERYFQRSCSRRDRALRDLLAAQTRASLE